ncbi:MAG: Fic family protein [Thermodesulfobacteriota bacterium]
MAEKLGMSKPSRYQNELVRKMLANGHIEYTIPDRPNSRMQKYRLTEQGRAWLSVIQKNYLGNDDIVSIGSIICMN